MTTRSCEHKFGMSCHPIKALHHHCKQISYLAIFLLVIHEKIEKHGDYNWTENLPVNGKLSRKVLKLTTDCPFIQPCVKTKAFVVTISKHFWMYKKLTCGLFCLFFRYPHSVWKVL